MKIPCLECGKEIDTDNELIYQADCVLCESCFNENRKTRKGKHCVIRGHRLSEKDGETIEQARELLDVCSEELRTMAHVGWKLDKIELNYSIYQPEEEEENGDKTI